MPKFFINVPLSDIITVDGEDAAHIINSLRMKTGDKLTLCDGCGMDYHCVITKITTGKAGQNLIDLKISEKTPIVTEPGLRLSLFQALPKGDKIETIIQKAVELGVSEITPFIPSRAVSRPDPGSSAKKHARYNKIAREAAIQSERGIIPPVNEICRYEDILYRFNDFDKIVFCYENGGERMPDIISGDEGSIAVIIGNEGGFEPDEVERAKEAGAVCATLGPRVLRCETAPVCAVSLILLLTGNI